MRGPALKSSTRARTVLSQVPNLVPLQVADFGKPRPGQLQQPYGCDRSRVFFQASVQYRAEAFQRRTVEVPGNRPARVPDDVGAGVADVLAQVAPLPAQASMARRISKAILTAQGLSMLAASNHAEIRAWSIASSRSRPKHEIPQQRRPARAWPPPRRLGRASRYRALVPRFRDAPKAS